MYAEEEEEEGEVFMFNGNNIQSHFESNFSRIETLIIQVFNYKPKLAKFVRKLVIL